MFTCLIYLAKGLVHPMKTAFSTRLPLVVGMWITGAVAVLGLGAATLRPKAMAQPIVVQPATPAQLARQLALQPGCLTVATDPQAPLNIRTVPSAAQSGSIVGSVNNGTILKVVDVQSDWLKIAQPVAGWVHQPLTATSCAHGQSSASALPAIAPTQQVINSAYDRFAAGQLQAALALLQSVPQTDATYPQAQSAYQTMSQQWHQGHVAYQSAQQAIAQGQWQVAINQVKHVPDVRYWREQMAPLVKQAIVNQSTID
jgi:hypothetical protein